MTAVSVVLLCAALFAGCRSNTDDIDGKQDTNVTATATPQPTATPTPTPMPTPTPIPFVHQAYATFGRDDVYLVPSEPPETKYRARISTQSAGEYILNWYSVWDGEDDIDSSYVMELLAPGIGNGRYTLKPDVLLNQPYLLKNGTVILNGYENGMVCVYDNTLTEVASFIPGGEGGKVPLIVGASDDGTIWAAYDDAEKLYAYDLTGELQAEYEYDEQLLIAKGWKVTGSDSTWFLNDPGRGDDTFTFPKSDTDEWRTFVDGDFLCSCVSKWSPGSEGEMDYRLYDLKERTVSEPLPMSDIPGCSYLTAYGLLPDGYLVLIAQNVDGEESLLLWEPGTEYTPIDGFCDLSETSPAEYIAERSERLKSEYGIEITPDRPEEGEEASEEDLMVEIEIINTFMLYAKQGSGALKTSSGEILHPENMFTNDGAHYEFDPHVFSKYYLKEHGEARRDAFFRYVDALRAGEDSFECPNIGTAEWISGRLAKYFFPVGAAYCDTEYVGDGRAAITYRIPKEEFLEKEREFERMVTAIVNDAVEEDYTDFEKALALYEFMTEYCVYDYEMLEHNGEEEWDARQSGYRVLVEKQGICWEIACLYRYLLLQCGVDSEESTGMPLTPGEDLHEWNYIELDGIGYLIDATWGLTTNREPDLTYFMFTDELRRDRDGYDPDSFDLAGNGLYGARKVYGFKAEDERYSELWGGRYIAFDENEKCIFYKDMNGALQRFDYGDPGEATE